MHLSILVAGVYGALVHQSWALKKQRVYAVFAQMTIRRKIETMKSAWLD